MGNAVPAPGANVWIAPGTNVTKNATNPILSTVNTLYVQNGGTLTFGSNTATITLTCTTLNDSATVNITNNSATANLFTVTNFNVANGSVFTNNASLASALAVTHFDVFNGGTYTHNAIGSTASGSGAVDFPGGSGSITLGTSSNVTVTNWGNVGMTGSLAPLPAHVQWGNLTINLSGLTLNSNWQQNGVVDSIYGNFTLSSMGTFAKVFFLDSSVPTNFYIGGNLTVSDGYFSILNGAVLLGPCPHEPKGAPSVWCVRARTTVKDKPWPVIALCCKGANNIT